MNTARICRPFTAIRGAPATHTAVLDGIHEAGNPYFDYVFGGAAPARQILTRWSARSSSEVSLARAFLLIEGDDIVGGFIAVAGKELLACRKADGVALATVGARQQRVDLLERLGRIRNLFILPDEQEFFLSKVWVDAKHRGAGYSKDLMASYVDLGRRSGFSRFRLDVCADNRGAIALYRTFGFKEVAVTAAPEAGMTYVSMAMGLVE